MSPIATDPSWQLRQNLVGPVQVVAILASGVPPTVCVASFHVKVFWDRV
jgi:hypothetical protein